MRDFHRPGRSVVYGTRGAAATSHPLATMAAVDVLKSGGNAVDAALSACVVQGVVEPHNTGIGGDCFAFVWRADQKRMHALNGSGFAPAAISAASMRSDPAALGPDSVHSITIPGAVDAWDRLLNQHGTIAWTDLLAPAIDFAEHGFIIHERVAHDWATHTPRLMADEGAAAHYLFDGKAPRAGDRIRLPALGASLGRLAQGGRDEFYKGDLAAAMVSSLRAIGGKHTREDFAAIAATEVTPITRGYRGVDMLQIPPNGQGITALILLGILEGFDHSALDPVGPDRFHLQIEAARLAYAVRDAYVADPSHTHVPVEDILSENFIDRLRDRVDPRRAAPAGIALPDFRQRDTVYITTVDSQGNCCSLINSLFHSFGSAKVCPQTGVIFQNRGAGFVLEDGHPNCLAPSKRPMHTIIPGFAMRDGAPLLSFGVMGGSYQPVGQVQVLQNILDFGVNVQEAIDMPRGLHDGTAFDAERGIPEPTLRDLAARGHPIRLAENPWGGGQAILVEQHSGILAAGSDCRKDGCALAF